MGSVFWRVTKARTFAGLLHPTWLELPSWPINKEVFQDELAFPAIKWTTAVVALDLSV
jgi:hypothetical protein